MINDVLFIKNAKIISKGIICTKDIKVSEGKTELISEGIKTSENASVIDADGSYLCSGFIDIHVHGGGGSDFMDATENDFEKIANFHLKHGTTSMLATTTTSSEEELLDVLACMERYKKTQHTGAQVLGLHLEGPFINEQQKGAQDSKFIKKPDKDYINKILNASSHIKRISAAPEVDKNWIIATACKQNNISLSAGHTSCSAAEAIKAYNEGYNSVTHFYSSMNSVIRKNCFRVAGLVEAAYLTDGMTVEVIADGCHLPKELLQLIYKIKGAHNIALITDCSAAAGSQSINAKIGSRNNGMPVVVKDGVAFLEDMSSFAGSIATADKLFNTMFNSTNAGLENCIKMLTETPSKILEIDDKKGFVREGYDADFVIFDLTNNKMAIKNVIVNGKIVI